MLYRICIGNDRFEHCYEELGTANTPQLAMELARKFEEAGYQHVEILDRDWKPATAKSCYVAPPMPPAK